jgi:hypothetical protein
MTILILTFIESSKDESKLSHFARGGLSTIGGCFEVQ